MDIVCAVSETGDIFFLSFDEKNLYNIIPYCFFESEQKINSLCWSSF